jgi:nucleoid DNA-binding protein
MAGGLHTFTEQELDVSLTDSIASQISRADTIVFLGFGFHDQNIRLLKSNERSKVQRVFATAKGISSADREVVEFEIRSALGASSNLRIELREDLECTSLFDEYQRQLCSA